MTSENLLPMIKDIATIFAAIISAFSLFIFTQKDKQSYLRINVNSKKTEFKIVLENVGSNLAKIEKIKLKKVNVEADPDELSLSKLFADSAEATNNDKKKIIYITRSFSNLTGDYIRGDGVKHNLFSCTVEDIDSLKALWNIIQDYQLTVEYRDVFGMRSHHTKICISHFAQDYQSFSAALGNRTEFISEGCDK